jgi:uncharacterized metal-binding protein
MGKQEKVNIVPCSGIGKPMGTVSRLAAHQITEDVRPDASSLIPLALLVLGDETTNELIQAQPSITVDGCKRQCAKKIVGECGGKIIKELVVMDIYRDHSELKPAGIAELNEGGKQLAKVITEMMIPLIDQNARPEKVGENA